MEDLIFGNDNIIVEAENEGKRKIVFMGNGI